MIPAAAPRCAAPFPSFEYSALGPRCLLFYRRKQDRQLPFSGRFVKSLFLKLDRFFLTVYLLAETNAL
jgi:hypothetical protein